jgi:hypothetical protein
MFSTIYTQPPLGETTVASEAAADGSEDTFSDCTELKHPYSKLHRAAYNLPKLNRCMCFYLCLAAHSLC